MRPEKCSAPWCSCWYPAYISFFADTLVLFNTNDAPPGLTNPLALALTVAQPPNENTQHICCVHVACAHLAERKSKTISCLCKRGRSSHLRFFCARLMGYLQSERVSKLGLLLRTSALLNIAALSLWCIVLHVTMSMPA